MADYLIKGETLSGIADAIRSKTGQSRNFRTSKMAEEINKIPLNGEIVEPILQNKTITENGTYTAESGYDGFNEVIVEVSSGSGGDGETGGTSIETCEITIDIQESRWVGPCVSDIIYTVIENNQIVTKYMNMDYGDWSDESTFPPDLTTDDIGPNADRHYVFKIYPIKGTSIVMCDAKGYVDSYACSDNIVFTDYYYGGAHPAVFFINENNGTITVTKNANS